MEMTASLTELGYGSCRMDFFLNLYGTVETINIRNIRFDLTIFISESITTNFLCYVFLSMVVKY